jgi:hypothetical protein
VKFITQIEKSTLKFIWKHKGLQIAKTMLSKKSNARGIIVLDFKLYYRPIVVKTAWYLHKTYMKTSGKQWKTQIGIDTPMHT